MFFRRKKQTPPTFEERLEAARRLDFTVEAQPDGASRYRVSRAGCAAAVEDTGTSSVRFTENPGVVVDGEIAKLVDRGYQKFLVTSKGSRPAQAEQLRALHHFDEELRKALEVPSLYNESLGTVSNRYVYDRVEGRE